VAPLVRACGYTPTVDERARGHRGIGGDCGAAAMVSGMDGGRQGGSLGGAEPEEAAAGLRLPLAMTAGELRGGNAVCTTGD
jgi:hypothetical protein